MSETFQKLLEQQQERARQSAKTQRLLMIGLVVVGVIALVFIVLRGDPSIKPLDINTATTEQLQTLTGVGPDLARKIIKGRPYKSAKDLLQVSGIGEKTLEKMKPRLKDLPLE
jgi:competence ComEA-like helix-hairpin-helix protein